MSTTNHVSPSPQPQNEIKAPHLPPVQQDDLIDFGQSDGQAKEVPKPFSHAPADLRAAQTENNGQQQLELEQRLRAASSSHGNQGSLIDFHEDLKRDLPGMETTRPHGVLKRHDTDTQSLDEFVDAEG